MKPTIKYEKKCGVCRKCRNNPELTKRIWASRYFDKNTPGAESLMTISKKFNIGYQSLLIHIRKHQNLDPEQKSMVELERIAKRAELTQIIQEGPLAAPKVNNATQVWDDVITTAQEALKSGEMKLTANHLLKAAKDKTDYDIKKKNQDMAIQEMMWHFASGEAVNISALYNENGSVGNGRGIIEGEASTVDDITKIFAGLTDAGEEGPSDFHNETAGDATSSRTSEVLEGDDF